MKKISFILIGFSLLFYSCSTVTIVKEIAKFEQATKIYFDKSFSIHAGGNICRIKNIQLIRDFEGNGIFVIGMCDHISHIYFETPGEIHFKIDLTAKCNNFEKYMKVKVKNYEIIDVKTYKDKLIFIKKNKELISQNIVNFVYLKSALEYLKEKEENKI